ncbi:alpha-2-macroglobulin family protein [Emticicia sp. SJ17W-69]|uniref:alpha-2-macroglobulin family protein n=1 Tax=Emticicia sp. SJ17W-69 TaxID=3421657 RepID=UPI003EBDC783
MNASFTRLKTNGFLRFFALLLFISYYSSLFIGCSKLNEVSISARNFEDEIQAAQNLVFTFNKDLVTDNDLENWEAIEYVRIEPKVEGVFKWSAKNELVFSPSNGFKAATNYKAVVTKEILRKSITKNYKLGDDSFEFHTPYLQAQKLESYWMKGADGKPLAKVKVDFNYPVQETEIANLMKVQIEEADAKFILNSTPNDQKVVLALDNAPSLKDESSLKTTIEKGVKIVGGSSSTQNSIQLEGVLPSPYSVKIIDIETGFEKNQGFVKVITTQQIAGDNLKDAFKIEPAVETQTELTENGFIIKGFFSASEAYTLTIKDNLRGTLGAKLDAELTKDLFFGEMPASIEFVSKKGLYLSSKGSRNVGIRITNIPKVQLKVVKIYENNLLSYVRNNRYENYEYDGEESGPNGFNYSTDDQGIYSDVIINRTIETGNLSKVHGVSVLNMPMPEQDKLRGVYLVNLNSNDEYYQNATKLVSVSDLGIIAKKSADGDELMVFVNSIIDAEPMGDVEIKLISSNNQVMDSQKTDSKGVIIFEKLSEKAPNFKLAMITARTADDFNYMLLEDTQVETSRFEVEGKRANATGFDAFVYGDRDIYRPGETIHFNTVLRDAKWASAEEIPLKIRLLLPNGREFKSFLKNTNAQGAVETSIPLDRAAVTGTYTIEILNGNDVLLTSKPISIEEFMPDRIKVDVSAKDIYRTGETVQLVATATNLFGPPASNRNYEMDFSLKRKSFFAKGFEGYSFDIQNDTKFNNDLRQGTTDEDGLAKQAFQLPATYQDMGVLEGKVFVTVFDETGRPLNRVKSFDVFTQDTFYGIGLADYYVGTHVPMNIPLAAVSNDGKVKNARAEVSVYRIDYQTIVEKIDGVIKYNSKRQDKLVQTKEVTFAAGKSAIKFIPQVSGEYEIRIAQAGAKSYASRQFYAYGYGSTSSSSFEVSNEGQVLMEFDKEKYEVGDKAKVLMKTPFVGKMLVTVEKGNVLEHFYVETDKKSAEIDISVTEEMLPNVYVTATLIRPMKGNDMPLTVAHGFAPMKVEKSSNQLPIEIVAVKESRSKRKQKVTIKTKANTELTISVVDEGILQIKNFKTPDIYNYFYQKQALEVSSHDLYQFLFPELSLASSSVGGDGYNLEKRVNPLSNGRTKLVAVWSGILKTGSGGEADFEFEIPQFSGDLRIMAVAYKDEAFGSANANMKVKDPIVISTGAPRFLSPNDEVMIPVTVTNTTKTTTTTNVSVNLTGGLSLQSANNQSITVPAGKEVRTMFSVKAPSVIGTGSIAVVVNGFKEKFSEKIDLTIRPSTSLLKTSLSGVVLAGKTESINLGNDYMAGTAQASLLVSRSPMVQFAKQLDYLLGYPHGCIEQTVSKAFPQLYFADFTKTIAKNSRSLKVSGENDWNPQFNVQAAIRKIENMQLASGAVSYWQGGDYESWWGTAFAAHFMLEAKKADFEVNEGNLNRMLDYLTTKTSMQDLTEIDYIYNETGTWTTRTIARHEMIYSLYTLAMAGKANQPVMNYYKSNANLLTTDERYMLGASFAQIGDEGSFKQLLPKDYIIENTQKQTGGSFASPIRNLAISLNSLVESDPENLQIPKLARVLSQAIKATPYLSTQESVFSFLALGKIAKRTGESNVTASLSVDNKILASFNGTDLNVEKGVAGKLVNISAKGKGSLYYFTQQEGLSATGSYVEEDNFLKVRRQFLSRTGQPISGSLKQNQLVVVKVSISSTLGTPVENVVVTDMLPAAFEIENPRLNEDRNMTWIKNASTPQHFDIRDDRINFYTTADATEKTFYYLVRVVSKGKFILGPVAADAMYNGDYRSYSGGGNVIVE